MVGGWDKRQMQQEDEQRRKENGKLVLIVKACVVLRRQTVGTTDGIGILTAMGSKEKMKLRALTPCQMSALRQLAYTGSHGVDSIHCKI